MAVATKKFRTYDLDSWSPNTHVDLLFGIYCTSFRLKSLACPSERKTKIKQKHKLKRSLGDSQYETKYIIDNYPFERVTFALN